MSMAKTKFALNLDALRSDKAIGASQQACPQKADEARVHIGVVAHAHAAEAGCDRAGAAMLQVAPREPNSLAMWAVSVSAAECTAAQAAMPGNGMHVRPEKVDDPSSAGRPPQAGLHEAENALSTHKEVVRLLAILVPVRPLSLLQHS